VADLPLPLSFDQMSFFIPGRGEKEEGKRSGDGPCQVFLLFLPLSSTAESMFWVPVKSGVRPHSRRGPQSTAGSCSLFPSSSSHLVRLPSSRGERLS